MGAGVIHNQAMPRCPRCGYGYDNQNTNEERRRLAATIALDQHWAKKHGGTRQSLLAEWAAQNAPRGVVREVGLGFWQAWVERGHLAEYPPRAARLVFGKNRTIAVVRRELEAIGPDADNLISVIGRESQHQPKPRGERP